MMKKFLIGIITCGLFWGYSIANDTSMITNIIQSIQQTNKNKTPQQQITNYQQYTSKIQKLPLDTKTKAALQSYLQAKRKEIQSTTQDTTISGITTPITSINNINIEKIKTTRLERHNKERATQKLDPYVYDEKLNMTATQRANYLSSINTTTHRRSAKDGYYNYTTITNRFNALGVNFNETKGTLFSESLGRGLYSCSKSDCTTDLTKSIKSTFNFFMSEKGRRSQPHYKGIVSKQFSKIGLGIAYNAKSKKYFLVTHYSVKVK